MELSERAQIIADSHGHEWMCERIVELEDKLDAQILVTAFTQDDKEQLNAENEALREALCQLGEFDYRLGIDAMRKFASDALLTKDE